MKTGTRTMNQTEIWYTSVSLVFMKNIGRRKMHIVIIQTLGGINRKNRIMSPPYSLSDRTHSNLKSPQVDLTNDMKKNAWSVHKGKNRLLMNETNNSRPFSNENDLLLICFLVTVTKNRATDDDQEDKKH
jgi:hypothetical protein